MSGGTSTPGAQEDYGPGSRVHWIVRAAVKAGFQGAETLEFDPKAPLGTVWSSAAASCGVSMPEMTQAIADLFRIEVADLSTTEPTAVKLLPEAVARKFGAFPLRADDHQLVVAVSNPADPEAEHEIGFASGRNPSLQVCHPGEIARAIDAAYSPGRAAARILAGVPEGAGDAVDLAEEPVMETITEEEMAAGPIVRLANMMLQSAVEQGASDIHVQPRPSGGVVRFRIDGMLRTGMRMPLSVMTRVVSRIKIMGNLDIADHLRPQDGRTRIKVHDRHYDLRISTVPARRAEKVVIRVLDPSTSGTLEETGILEADLERIRRALSHRDGIFVVTGPTGSGKTTTLYGALREITTDEVNVMTVEDPVEYELAEVTQIQVETTQGVTFASALRAILRQDPDVIFVGEIRDAETTKIAAQASLTGHLVLATLHTNDAVGSIRRFIDLGLEPGTVVDVLRAALAQRLLRKVCSVCSEPVVDPLTSEEEGLLERFGVRPTVRATGCEHCFFQGYQGRLPITEFMATTGKLVRLILDGAPHHEVQAQAVADGMTTLLDSALERVRLGQTTLEEVARVLGDYGETVSDKEEREADDDAEIGEEDDERDHHEAAGVIELGEDAVPIPAAPGDRLSSEATSEDAGPQIDGAPHVLILDDDSTTRQIARALLEKEGCRVTEAVDGSEGLALLARGKAFDLMVLDLHMPMLGGKEVLAAVRRSMVTAALPVVVLTGTTDDGAEVELLAAGADDYIRKPLDPKRFLVRIQAALRRASA